MLTNIETKLEEFLTLADSLPPEHVEAMEKSREKERRQVAREDKILQQQQDHVRSSFPTHSQPKAARTDSCSIAVCVVSGLAKQQACPLLLVVYLVVSNLMSAGRNGIDADRSAHVS